MNSFRTRLLVAVISLVVLVQAVTTIAVLARTRAQLEAAAATQMQASMQELHHALASRLEVTTNQLAVIVEEEAVKAAVAARDPQALQSVLSGYANPRLKAQFVYAEEGGELFTSPANLPSSTRIELAASVHQAFARLHGEIGGLEEAPSRDYYTLLGGHPYRVAVMRTTRDGHGIWVGAGFAITDDSAAGLRDLAGLDVSYIARTGEGRSNLVSTLPRELRPHLYSLPLATLSAVTPRLGELAGEPYLDALESLNAANGTLQMLVQLPMRDTYARFEQLRWEMLAICGAALLVAAALVMLLSRRAMRPIDALVVAAQRIEQGHYSEPISIKGGSEFERLAAVLDGMQRRIAERESRIVHQARHDQLTGLPNRLAARARLARLLTEQSSVGLVLIDLRGFKHLNASFGYQLGDQVLREVGRRLAGAVRPEDCVARLGADQFLLLLSGSSVEHSAATAAQVVRGIRQGVLLGSIEVNLDVCAGVCAAPEHGTEAEELLRRADIALQEAKKGNNGLICRYEPGHDESYRKRLKLIADLHTAIVADQLSLVYQPKVLMADRRVRSLEALVRWTHPQFGPIPPGEFVPLAEQTGSIGELTRWVLRTAIAQLAKWRAAGFESELAVNLSASDLSDAELPDEILGLLARHDVLPRQLQLEITESVVMRELDRAVRVMRRLRESGIRFAIDDFGTGHSSLAQLKALPVDEVKIERSFVRDLEQGTRDDAIVRSAIELAHSLSLKVVAEGIETPQAWTALLRLGCDYAQGYFVSRPLAPEQVGDWIREANARLAAAESGTAQVRVLTELRGIRR